MRRQPHSTHGCVTWVCLCEQDQRVPPGLTGKPMQKTLQLFSLEDQPMKNTKHAEKERV